MPDRKKSFREIARELQVSPATVSRIAGGVRTFSAETISRVTDALQKEGYQTASESSIQRVATVAADLSSELYNKILAALSRYLKRQGVLLEIYLENQDPQALLQEIQASRPLGVFLVGTPLHPFSMESEIPAVQVLSNSHLQWKGKTYAVFSDEYVGGKLAARALIDKSCHQPVILNNRHTASEASLRIRGFLDAWQEAGLSVQDVYIHDGEPFKSAFNSAHDIISYLLVKKQPMDCIFACSDWRAYGAITALQAMNAAVPDRVKVIGFDGERVSRYCALPFATIQQNPDLIATHAWDLLSRLINGEAPVPETVMIPVQIQKGMTV